MSFRRLLLTLPHAFGLLSTVLTVVAGGGARSDPSVGITGPRRRPTFENAGANSSTAEGIIPPREYHLAPGDWVSVRFAGPAQAGPADPGPLKVDPAGSIVLPVVGPQKIAGLTLPGAESMLEQAEAKSGRREGPVELVLGALAPPTDHFEVQVAGEAETPGKYLLPDVTPKTVLDLITVAKPNILAVLKGVKLRRVDREGETTTIVINFAAKTGDQFTDPKVNLPLQPKDVLMIEECLCLE